MMDWGTSFNNLNVCFVPLSFWCCLLVFFNKPQSPLQNNYTYSVINLHAVGKIQTYATHFLCFACKTSWGSSLFWSFQCTLVMSEITHSKKSVSCLTDLLKFMREFSLRFPIMPVSRPWWNMVWSNRPWLSRYLIQRRETFITYSSILYYLYALVEKIEMTCPWNTAGARSFLIALPT